MSCSFKSNLVSKIKWQTLLQTMNVLHKSTSKKAKKEKKKSTMMDSFIDITLKGKHCYTTCTQGSYIKNVSKVVICRQKRKLHLCLLWLFLKRNNKTAVTVQVEGNQLWSSVFVSSFLMKKGKHDHLSPPSAPCFSVFPLFFSPMDDFSPLLSVWLE